MGWHTCDLCTAPFDGPIEVTYQGQTVRMGISNLFIPDGNQTFASPSLIAHYIQKHEYYPPEVFLRAVDQCPEMLSEEYFLKLSTSGMNINPDHLEAGYGVKLDRLRGREVLE